MGKPKGVIAQEDSFGDHDLTIREQRITNPEPEIERIDIDTIDISEFKTKPVER